VPSKTFHFGPDSEDGSWASFDLMGHPSSVSRALASILEELPSEDLWFDGTLWYRPRRTHNHARENPIDIRQRFELDR
jgi:hypothetical protein